LVSFVTLDASLEHLARAPHEGWRAELERLSHELIAWAQQTRALSASLAQRAQTEQKRRQELEREALLNAIGFMTLITLIGVGATFYLARLLAPLRQLKEGVTRLEEGNYEHRVEVGGGGALAQLADALNRMAQAIMLRDAQLEAQQAERLHQARLATVGHLTAQITHELRNPLSSIGLNAELLDEELVDLKALATQLPPSQHDELNRGVEDARPLLREISREVDRLRQITEDYLRFARLPRVQLAPLDLNAHCSELIEFVRAECEEAGVSLQLDPDPQPSEAYADANHTRSALLNLLRNAREALTAQGGGRVILRVRSWGDEACVSVEDDGPGLSEEAKERLFEPFFSTKPQGTGLGLAMARQLIEAQGGRLEVSSTQGEGVSASLYMRVVPLDH
jgi:signal transduction histidine kinase